MKIMRTMEPGKIPLEIIDKLLPFWKDFQRIHDRIPKNLKGFTLISIWIKGCIELHVKKAIYDVLTKEKDDETEALKQLTIEIQENTSKILKFSEEKEFLKISLASKEEKDQKDLRKFARNKENPAKSPKKNNLKFLLKGNNQKEEENLKQEDSSSIINVSEEIFNLTYKSPHSQDLRHKFLINCPKNNQVSINKGQDFIFQKAKEIKKIKINIKKQSDNQNLGFLTSRNEKKVVLHQDERKSSLSILRKPHFEGGEIDEYELNLRENYEENSNLGSKGTMGELKKNNSSLDNNNDRLCSNNCCRNSCRKWC